MSFFAWHNKVLTSAARSAITRTSIRILSALHSELISRLVMRIHEEVYHLLPVTSQTRLALLSNIRSLKRISRLLCRSSISLHLRTLLPVFWLRECPRPKLMLSRRIPFVHFTELLGMSVD